MTLSKFTLLSVAAAFTAVGTLSAYADAPPPITTSDRIASISAAGVKLGGFGVVSSAKISTGTYEVIFTRLVAKCVASVTVGQLSSTNVPTGGYGTAVQRGGNPRGIFVETFDTTGTSADQPFMVHLGCF